VDKQGRAIVNVLHDNASSSETSVTFIILPRRNFKDAPNILHCTVASGSETTVASNWIPFIIASSRGEVYVSIRTQQYIGRKSVPLAQKVTSHNPELRSACPKDLCRRMAFLIWKLRCHREQLAAAVVASFQASAAEVFALVGCYIPYVDSFVNRSFGTAHRSHLQGSTLALLDPFRGLKAQLPTTTLRVVCSLYQGQLWLSTTPAAKNSFYSKNLHIGKV
jgi:hypothetical protein